MRTASHCIPLLLALAAARPVAAQPRPSSPTVLVGVTVIDVERGVRVPGRDVVMDGGRIVAVRPTGRPLAGARIVRANGLFVIPGLWDMHSHMGYPEWGIDPVADSLTRAYYLGILAAAGVTGARDLGGDLAYLLRWQRIGTWPGGPPMPHLVATGQKLGQAAVVPGAPFPLQTADDVHTSVRMLRERGAAHVKLAPGVPEWVVRAGLEACRAQSIPCIGHVPREPDFLEAARLGIRDFEHLFVYGDHMSTVPLAELVELRREIEEPTILERVAYKLGLRPRPHPDAIDSGLVTHSPARALEQFRALAATGAWVSPTLTLHDMILRIERRHPTAADSSLVPISPPPGLVDVRSDAQRALAARQWATFQAMVRELHAAQVPLLAGSDFAQGIPGFSLHLELELLQGAGLPAVEALRAATINPARYFGATDTLGTVAVGRVADLVVLREDPLEDIVAVESVEMVVSRGRVMPRTELDALLAASRSALRALRARAAAGRH